MPLYLVSLSLLHIKSAAISMKSIILFVLPDVYLTIYFAIILVSIIVSWRYPKYIVNIYSYIIKRLSQGDVKSFLNRYDGTDFRAAISKTVNNSLIIEDIGNTSTKEESQSENRHADHSFIMSLCYILFNAFLVAIIVKIIFIYNPEFFMKPFYGEYGNILYEKTELSELLLHIDLAGLITGFLGILVGIIVALIVEDENRIERKRTNTTNVKKLEEIIGTTQTIINSHTALIPKYKLSERLDSLLDIIKMAQENCGDNEFYVMNFSADFSYLRSHNVKIVLDYGGISKKDDLKKISQKSYHSIYQDIDAKNNQILKAFEYLIKFRNQPIHFAILGIDKNNSDLKCKYERYLDKVLERAEVSIYAEGGENSFVSVIPEDITSSKDKVYYSFADREEFKGIDGNEKDFIKNTLYKHNINQISKLKDWGFETKKILYLDNIPFQFAISHSKGNGKSKALITIANVDEVGSNAGIFGFETTNIEIINNLINIYKVLKTSQRRKSRDFENDRESIGSLKKLFNVESNNCFTILKFKDFPEDKSEPEFYKAVPQSDIKAAVKIREIFQEYVNFIPTPKYIGIGEDFVDNDSLFYQSENNTYIIIGLFGSDPNPTTITEHITSKDSRIPIEFVRKNNSPKKAIYSGICSKNTLFVRLNENNWKPYEAIWENTNSGDIAMFAKLKISGKTVLIAGGLNHYGTERVGVFIKENWKELIREVDDNQFVFLIDIPPRESTEPMKILEESKLICEDGVFKIATKVELSKT